MTRFKLLLVFLFCLSGWSACNKITNYELLAANWEYDQILIDNVQVMEVGKADELQLNESGEFSYHLHLAGRSGEGSWEFRKPDTLSLHYQKPDTIRHFIIKVLTKNRLEFTENEILFTFNKSNK